MNETKSRPPCVQRTEHDGVVVLAAIGGFELGCVETLRAALGRALSDHNRVVLDLSQTTFANSTALAAVLSAWAQATKDGGWVRLANPRQNVRKLLHVTAIDTLIDLHDTVEGALGGAADAQAGGDSAAVSA